MPDQGWEFIGSIFCEQYNCQAQFYLEPSHSGEPRPATGTGVRHLIALYGEGYTGPADRSLTENGRRGSRSVFQTVGLSSNFSIFSWRRSTKHLFQSGKRRPAATVSTCSNRNLHRPHRSPRVLARRMRSGRSVRLRLTPELFGDRHFIPGMRLPRYGQDLVCSTPSPEISLFHVTAAKIVSTR
jgi:hypothetical protein